jgi:hypothetical protein
MTKTHKYKINRRLNFETMVPWNRNVLVGSGLNGRAAADVDQRETLKETAIIKRL